MFLCTFVYMHASHLRLKSKLSYKLVNIHSFFFNNWQHHVIFQPLDALQNFLSKQAHNKYGDLLWW